MSDPSERLAQLPDLLDDGGPSPEIIRERARQRVRRRRAAVAVPVLSVVLVLGGAALLIGVRDDPQAVTADRVPGTSTSAVPATLPASMAPSGLTAVPVLDLDDGARIAVSFDHPADAAAAAFVAVCDAEVVNQAYRSSADAEGLLSWCGEPVMGPEDPTELTVELTVERFLTTPGGTVDCSANVGRCVVAASLERPSGWSPVMRWSPLGFTAPERAPLTVRADSTSVEDGDVITVSGDGALPGESVTITQCIAEPVGPYRDTDECDAIRWLEVQVDNDGHFETDFIAYREILTHSPDGSQPSRWMDCEPCYLVAARSNGQGDPASAAISVAEAAAPIRPRVEVLEPTPLRPGQSVTLSGSGFQTAGGRAPTIQICPTGLDSPHGACSFESRSLEQGPDSNGEFTVDDFELPGPEYLTRDGTRCAGSAACSLGSVPGEGIAYLFSDPLDLSG
jgi:hypothetical protein